MSSTRAAIVIGAVFFVACSSSSSSDGGASTDLATYCQKTATCGTKDIAGQTYDQQECEVNFAGWIPPPGCAAAVASASCSDFTLPVPTLSPSIKNICTPSCALSEHPDTCSADQTQWTTCESLGQLTYDCAARCAAGKLTFTGTCGTSYGGQTSTEPKCWCK